MKSLLNIFFHVKSKFRFLRKSLHFDYDFESFVHQASLLSMLLADLYSTKIEAS